jgi:hypothetical protein
MRELNQTYSPKKKGLLKKIYIRFINNHITKGNILEKNVG